MKINNSTVVYDQFFLKDDEVMKKMITELELSYNHKVLEIGPGYGNLTKLLSGKAKKVVVVEIDSKFKNHLNFPNKKTELVIKDAIIYLDEKIKQKAKFDRIISSLPSSLVEPFFGRLIELNFQIAVLLVPLTFVKKLNNLLFSTFFQTILVQKVSKNSFSPQPKANWALLKIYKSNKTDGKSLLIKYLYFHRKAKLKNSLTEAIIYLSKINKHPLTKNQSRLIVKKLNVEEKKLNNPLNMNDLNLNEFIDKIISSIP